MKCISILPDSGCSEKEFHPDLGCFVEMLLSLVFKIGLWRLVSNVQKIQYFWSPTKVRQLCNDSIRCVENNGTIASNAPFEPFHFQSLSYRLRTLILIPRTFKKEYLH